MTTTFKELPISARFRANNRDEIIYNRGDKKDSRPLGSVFIKRDAFGGHILSGEFWTNASVYYRIEPDNEVETI
jgi:hypothetical protein